MSTWIYCGYILYYPVTYCSKLKDRSSHKRHSIDVIYFDFAKVSDSVPHVRLLPKLKSYGIVGKLDSYGIAGMF